MEGNFMVTHNTTAQLKVTTLKQAHGTASYPMLI